MSKETPAVIKIALEEIEAITRYQGTYEIGGVVFDFTIDLSADVRNGTTNSEEKSRAEKMEVLGLNVFKHGSPLDLTPDEKVAFGDYIFGDLRDLLQEKKLNMALADFVEFVTDGEIELTAEVKILSASKVVLTPALRELYEREKFGCTFDDPAPAGSSTGADPEYDAEIGAV